MTEIDTVLIGFVGGVFGCLGILSLTHYYWVGLVKKQANDLYRLRNLKEIEEIEKEIITLRIQVTALQSQFGII